MRYFIEDTNHGFRVGYESTDRTITFSLEEDGSHGELAKLYSNIERLFHRSFNDSIRRVRHRPEDASKGNPEPSGDTSGVGWPE